MKTLVILICAALTAAAPAQNAASNPEDVKVLRFDSDNDGTGNYNFNFEQSDGTTREETGEVRNAGTKDEFVAVRGSYSWVGPDGDYKTVTYIADENGFQPVNEQRPSAPVPVGVIEALLKQ